MSRDYVGRALSDRQMVPRWRAPRESLDEQAGLGIPRKLIVRQGWLEQLTVRFDQYPTRAAATELMETASVLGVDLPPSTMAAVVGAGYKSARISKKERHFHAGDVAVDGPQKIADLKATLKEQPRQPLAWTELARYYLAIGQQKQAKSAMQAAVFTAPENRYVLRSASRLFNHIDEPEIALRALKASGRLSRDPWLLSAELALQTSGKSKTSNVKHALGMLGAKEQSPRNLAELAAAVGTIEHENGNHRAAKRLFTQSLVDPTENSVAQALYISQLDTKIRVPDGVLDDSLSFEAQARSAFAKGKWGVSLDRCNHWLLDEPFDIKPAIVGSCLSFDESLANGAVDLASLGLRCSPNDALLLNNRAVGHAYCGRPKAAYDDLFQALRSETDKAHLLATLGLLQYRNGQAEEGQRSYSMSIAWLAKIKDRQALLRAYLYWLREAVRVGTVDGSRELVEARKLIGRLPKDERENEVPGLLEAIEREQIARADRAMTSPAELLLDFDGLRQRIEVPTGVQEIYAAIAPSDLPQLLSADDLIRGDLT